MKVVELVNLCETVSGISNALIAETKQFVLSDEVVVSLEINKEMLMRLVNDVISVFDLVKPTFLVRRGASGIHIPIGKHAKWQTPPEKKPQ